MPEDPKPAEGEGQAPTAQEAPAGNTLAQDEVNKLVGNARVEARSALLKKFGVSTEDELKTVLARAKELEEAQLTEVEKRDKRIAELEAQAAAAQAAVEAANLANLRARIGREKGLPEPLIERLVATDEEGISAEVDALLPFLRDAAQAPQQLGGGTNPAAAGDMTGDPDQKMANLLVRSLTGR